MDEPGFVPGRGVSLDDQAAWSALAPVAGQIVEVDTLKTNRIVNAIVECWEAFFIKSVQTELDGSFVLEVYFMGCEEDEGEKLSALFSSGPRHTYTFVWAFHALRSASCRPSMPPVSGCGQPTPSKPTTCLAKSGKP